MRKSEVVCCCCYSATATVLRGAMNSENDATAAATVAMLKEKERCQGEKDSLLQLLLW
jgi:hypothetical protein